MRREQHRRPAQVRIVENLEHLLREVGIEIAGRLVGDQHERIVDQRTGDRDALLLATGKLQRVVIDLVLQIDRAERAVRFLLVLLRGKADGRQDE